jgi:hypothetical protein
MSHRNHQARHAAISTRKGKWLMPGVVMLLVLGLAGAGFRYAAHLEESDAFCASCHTEPETTFMARTQAATSIDLASWHAAKSTRCIDCHSGPGFVGRMQGMSIGAGDLFTFITHTDKQSAPLTVPITDGHCLKCHADVPNNKDFNRHFHAFLGQWQAADPQAAHCVDCHTGHATNGDPQLQFLNQQETSAVCQRRHAFAGRG